MQLNEHVDLLRKSTESYLSMKVCYRVRYHVGLMLIDNFMLKR